MEVNTELVSPYLILSDALIKVDDEANRKGITKGWYMGRIQWALEKLAMNAYFNQVVIEVPMPANGRYKLPNDFFNLVLLYAYNGSCCNPNSGSANIYYKRNYYTKDARQGYTAMNKADRQSSADPYFTNDVIVNANGGTDNNYLFGNVQNGWLMLSMACTGYSGLQITYNSLGVDIGDTPVVPRPLREVVTDLVVLEAASVLMVKYPKSQYGSLYDRYNNKLYNRLNGTFFDAVAFCKNSSSWVKEMQSIYSSNYGGW